jgi:MATE family multidrug resistance protein
MGDVQLAANAVLINFQTFMAYGLDGFAHAAEALVGSAVGARDRNAFREAVATSTKWAALIALGFALVYLVAGGALIRTLTGIEAVRDSAAAFLPWAIASPLVSVWSFQLDGIFIGATRTAEMRNGMIVSLAGFLGLTALLVPIWGNHGLWLAFLLFMALRALTLAVWLPRLTRALQTAAADPIS